MRRYLELALVFVGLIVTLVAIGIKGGVVAAIQWEGVYRVEGVNPQGGTYVGAAEITRVPGVLLYQIVWRVAGDGTDVVAYGFEHDGQLHATGLSLPLAFVLPRNLEARWALPTVDFAKTLGRERFKRVNGKTLDEVQPPKPASINPALRVLRR